MNYKIFNKWLLLAMLSISYLDWSIGYAGPSMWTRSSNIPGYSITVSPSNPQIIYFSGGDFFGDISKLYRSIDGGNTWSFITTFGTSLGSVVIDRYSSNTIYLQVGGSGLLKSVDGCSSFFSLSTSPGYPIVTDPVYNNIFYCGVWFSRSTDYGQSWSLLTTGINNFVRAIAVDPTNQQHLYCSTDYSVYKSINGGITWTVTTTGLSGSLFSGLAIDPVNPNTLYLSSLGSPNFFKSTDSGNSWVVNNNGLTGLPLRSLLIDPSNSSTIYVATDGEGVYRSLDKASTWSNFNGTGTTSGKIIYNLAFSLSSPTTLFAIGEGVHSYSFITATSVPSSQWKQLDAKKPHNQTYSILSTATSLAYHSP